MADESAGYQWPIRFMNKLMEYRWNPVMEISETYWAGFPGVLGWPEDACSRKLPQAKAVE
jgi:hypothetical protein